jgi:hypothetical protein
MFNVTLLHLTADARATAGELSKIDLPNVSAAEMRRLLENFCEIDPLEHADADAEIRVQAPDRSWLIRAGQKKVILYDALNREAPGDIFTIDEAMAELDGTAAFAYSAPPVAAADATEIITAPAWPLRRRVRVVVLAAVVILLAGGIGYLRLVTDDSDALENFRPLRAAEAAATRESLAGVFLTGVGPGAHGIVVTATGELRLFQFRAVEPPRIVHAAGTPGRIGDLLCIVTDQPGGLIRVADDQTLMYCGETYTRVPGAPSRQLLVRRGVFGAKAGLPWWRYRSR